MRRDEKETAVAGRDEVTNRTVGNTFRALLACGALCATAQAAADYSQHPQAKAFVDDMVAQYKFERADVQAWLAKAQRQQSVLDAIARPAEKAKPWKDYRKLFVT